jgi:CubicO group peptidase (beta-lactamase class C family)
MADWVEEGRSPSIIVLAARRGRIVLHEAFGVLGPDADSPPLRRDSVFPASSITKPMTATALMMLVEDGLVGLNRPVVEYIPELCGEGADQICVHHLLTHTSGYMDDELSELFAKRKAEGFRSRSVEPTQHRAVQTYFEALLDAPLGKAPGEEMSYGSYHYTLLGEIVRRVSGQSLADFFDDRLFRPLGMSESWLVVPEAIRPRVVRFPEDAGTARYFAARGLDINSRKHETIPWAEGGAYSTVRDLAVFGQTFLNGGSYGGTRLLGPRTVKAMTRNHIPGVGTQFFSEFYKEASWGLGWTIASNDKWKYYKSAMAPIGSYNHGGMGNSILLIDPSNELVLVYFEVGMRLSEAEETITHQELFHNIIYSALDD